MKLPSIHLQMLEIMRQLTTIKTKNMKKKPIRKQITKPEYKR